MAIRFDRIELSDDGNHLYPYIEGTDGYLAIRTTSGLLRIGAGNSSYSHFYTDRGSYYFNTAVAFDGHVSAYGGDENLTNWNNVDGAQFRDKSNTGFYLDPAATGTSLNIAGAIQLPDSKAIIWDGNNILSHNGTQTYIGDNTSDMETAFKLNCKAYGINFNDKVQLLDKKEIAEKFNFKVYESFSEIENDIINNDI